MDMGRGSRESKPAYVKTIMHTNVTKKSIHTPPQEHIYAGMRAQEQACNQPSSLCPATTQASAQTKRSKFV